jgi:uncharacterized membrane protein YfcA
MQLYLLCAFSGALAGAVAGLCGVGGGVILVPVFVIGLHMEQKTAVATSLAIIIFTALVATVRNSGNQLVDWKVVAATALASSVVVWFASDWLKKMSNLSLTRIFAVFMIAMGLWMLGKSFSKG